MENASENGEGHEECTMRMGQVRSGSGAIGGEWGGVLGAADGTAAAKPLRVQLLVGELRKEMARGAMA
jgi:hypothetical protein